MKKIILELLTRYFEFIRDNWVSALFKFFEKKLSRSQLTQFVENTLRTIIGIVETSDYSYADKYLIELLSLFEHRNLNLLEVSQLFNSGRSSMLHIISRDKTGQYDPITIVEYIEEIIEQLFARYSMLHQERQMTELALDRDRLLKQIDQSEKLAVIGQLAAGVAHEIGNPLTSISSIVQLMQRRTKDSYFLEQLANVRANIDRISKIVRELVDFSRPPGYEKMYVQVNDIIRTALGIVRYDKRVRHVEFENMLETDLPMLNVVPDQLLQVFINILFNALDAINGEGKIEVASYSEDESVFVRIKDNGTGMDAETIVKIFDPFFTTKEVGRGTGLGLSVSYGIIKKFKGDILVESTPGEGSTFTVKLPVA